MRNCVVAVVCGLLVMLALVSCSKGPTPESSPSSSLWSAADVRGFPATAQITDVVVRRGVWVAVGSIQSRLVAGQPFDMALWRSSDGLSWREAYRTRGRGDESTKGHLAVTADGYAVVGTACENQTCQPMALVSSDGRSWRPASEPPVGFDAQGSPRGQVSGLAGVPDASGRPGRDLVAVGYAGGSPVSEPVVWRSHDAGRTWEGSNPGLGGPGRVAPLDWVVAVGQRVVAHGTEVGTDHLNHDVLWRSDDLGRGWARMAIPEGIALATKPGDSRNALLLAGHRPSGEPGLWRSEDLTHWTNPSTLPSHDGSLLDTAEGFVFARSQAYSDPDGRLEVWGSPPGKARFDRTYFLGPKEQPTLQAMLSLEQRVYVYIAVGRPGTRGFVRLSAGVSCAATHCPPAPAVPPDVVALTDYRAEPVPVLSGYQRVFVASEPGGGAWSDVTPDRLLGSAKESIQSVVFPDRDHGWLVVVNVEDASSWVLRTTDGGRSWTTTSYQGGFSMHAGTSLKVSAIDANHAWTAYVVPPASGRPLIARTTDGGRTWSGGDDSVEIADVIRFIDARRGFSADDFGFGPRGLFASTDGGVTWRESKIPLPAEVDPEQTSSSYGLPRFFDGRGILPVGIVEPERFNPKRARVAFYHSDDFGATWGQVSIVDLPVSSTVQATVSPEIWWAADGGGSVIAVTADAGRTWREHRPTGAGRLQLVDATDATTALATRWNGSTAGLVTTHDGGATWQPFPYPGSQPGGHPAPCPNPGPARIPAGATHRTVARGDLDGDGGADRLVFYLVHLGGSDADEGRMRAELTSGTVIDVAGGDGSSGERPFGAVDLDGDGREEIFVARDRSDSAGLRAVVLNGCRLTPVLGLGGSGAVYYDKKEQPGRGTSGVTCSDIDGDGHREVVAAYTGPEPETWGYSAYRIAGGYATLTRSAHGRAPGDPRPNGIRFGPGLQCEGLSP